MLSKDDRRRLLRFLTARATSDLNTMDLAELAGVAVLDAAEYRSEFDQAMLYAYRELLGQGLRIYDGERPRLLRLRR